MDSDGNVWVTDAVSEQRTPPGTRGQQVITFSPTAEKLMPLGTPEKAGSGRVHIATPDRGGPSLRVALARTS